MNSLSLSDSFPKLDISEREQEVRVRGQCVRSVGRKSNGSVVANKMEAVNERE